MLIPVTNSNEEAASLTGTITLAGFTGTADLRTPRSTFDTFCRSIVTGQAPTLWKSIDPDLRLTMQARFSREGDDRFFGRMRSVISNPQGRLCLGLPSPATDGLVKCPVMRNGRQVATASFRFTDRSWLLASLN